MQDDSLIDYQQTGYMSVMNPGYLANGHLDI